MAIRSMVVHLALCAGISCAPGCARRVLIDEPSHAKPQAPFTETIPSSTVSFRMIPVLGAGAGSPAFWLAESEATWDQFDLFVYGADAQQVDAAADAISRPSKPYLPPDRGYGHAGFPAISMSFHSAQQFCRWLSMQTGRHYRLPTVAEWSRACELGGCADIAAPERGWYAGNADDTTHAVMTRAADALGLYDMIGNAAEWCLGADGKPVVCGGSFRSEIDAIGCSARLAPISDWNMSDPQLPRSRWWLADAPFVGFRVLCDNPERSLEEKP